MALAESSVSAVCHSVAAFLSDAFRDAKSKVDVLVGPPAKAAEQAADTHCVNLFFHRFEPAGLFPDGTPSDIEWIRVHCLVTAFGVNDDSVSAGENDLRLLGEVMRIFHETPILMPVEVAQKKVRVQMVHTPLTLDDINRLWTTQRDVAFRPSVAYEVALVPIIPLRTTIRPSLAAQIEVSVQTSGGDRGLAFDWAPEIAFVAGGERRELLSFTVGSPELASFTARVAVAGAIGTPVELRWETWHPGEGWKPFSATSQVTIRIATLDGVEHDESATNAVELPFKDRAGQATLCAVRTFMRPGDTAGAEVRSNPLLVRLRSPNP